jgi:BirA family biotin operon repressor/biotin-[acetyl-CoA-carboxylase] ligase
MKQRILQLLWDEEGYISGSRISGKLNISRTAVWKQINVLRSEGYEIDSQTNRGYRLISIPDLLLPEAVKLELKTETFGQEIVYFDTIDSTNRKAKELASGGAAEGTVVVTEEQTGGRGRLGRSWLSPKGKGLWFSIVLRPQISPLDSPQLTLVSAVGVVKALKAYTGLDLKIKWPNDLLYGGKKVVGILTELAAEFGRVDYIVVGIGINVNTDLEDYPEELRDIVCSLKMVTGREQNRQSLLRLILQQLEQSYLVYLREGFSPIRTEWLKLSGTLGSRVKITESAQAFQGLAEDLDEQGRLIVRLSDGSLHPVLAGEIILI